MKVAELTAGGLNNADLVGPGVVAASIRSVAVVRTVVVGRSEEFSVVMDAQRTYGVRRRCKQKNCQHHI